MLGSDKGRVPSAKESAWAGVRLAWLMTNVRSSWMAFVYGLAVFVLGGACNVKLPPRGTLESMLALIVRWRGPETELPSRVPSRINSFAVIAIEPAERPSVYPCSKRWSVEETSGVLNVSVTPQR